MGTRRSPPVCEFHEPAQVETHGSGENRIPVLAADSQLHWLSKEPGDIDVIPAFLGVPARREIIDLDKVKRLVAQHWAEKFRFIPNLLPALDWIADNLAVIVPQ